MWCAFGTDSIKVGCNILKAVKAEIYKNNCHGKNHIFGF